MSLEKVLYEAKATATGGRDGKATSDDGQLNVKLARRKRWAVRVAKARTRSSCLRQGIPPVFLVP